MSKLKRHITESAHGKGKGAVCFHPSGKQIYTVGGSSINMFDAKTLSQLNDEPLKRAGEATTPLYALSFSAKGDQFVTGSGVEDESQRIDDKAAGDNKSTAVPFTVDLYLYPTNKFDALITRFTSAVHALAFNPSGNQLAVGGEYVTDA